MEQMVIRVLNVTGSAIYFLQGYIFLRVIGGFLEPGKNVICKAFCWLLATCVCGMIIFPNDTFNITASIPLFLLLLTVGYRGKMSARVSVFLLFFPIIIGLNFLGSEIGGFVWVHFTSGGDWINTLLAVLWMTAIMLFWYAFMKTMEKREARIIEILDNKTLLLLDVICLASLAAVISCVYFSPQESYKMWLCMLACVITNLGSIRLVFYLAESIRSELEKRNLTLQKRYYEEMEANQMELRSFRHDINNHFSVAAQLLQEGRNKEAKEYFESLSGRMSAGGRRFCQSGIVNAVLNAKCNRAEEKGIDCFFHIEIDKLLFVDPIDVCTIFFNTLDNAIEACMQIDREEERRISVKARCTANGYFSCEIRNAKRNAVRVEKGRYLTGKAERNHGIGLENVRQIVKRYQGTMEISHTEREFCVVILIAEEGGLV